MISEVNITVCFYKWEGGWTVAQCVVRCMLMQLFKDRFMISWSFEDSHFISRIVLDMESLMNELSRQYQVCMYLLD